MIRECFTLNDWRYIYSLLFFILLALLLAGCSPANTSPPVSPPNLQPYRTAGYPVTISNFDAAERPVAYTYHKAPAKVVVTHPGATEMLLELGLEDRVHSTIMPYGAPLERLAGKYAKLPITKAPFVPTLEELLDMQPDIIIGWPHHFDDSHFRDVKSWHERGVATYIIPGALSKGKPSLETALYAFIQDIGTIFDIQEQTSLYMKKAKERVAWIESKVKDIPRRKTVLIMQDYANGTFSLYDSSYLIHHLVELAGGRNLCEERASWIGAEKVLAFDPDVIIFVSINKQDSAKDLTDTEALAQVQDITALQSMRAIRQGNIINLPFFTVNNGGVRTIDTIEKIARQLYPERF